MYDNGDPAISAVGRVLLVLVIAAVVAACWVWMPWWAALTCTMILVFGVPALGLMAVFG